MRQVRDPLEIPAGGAQVDAPAARLAATGAGAPTVSPAAPLAVLPRVPPGTGIEITLTGQSGVSGHRASTFAERYEVTVRFASTGKSSVPVLAGGPRSSNSSTTIGVSDLASARSNATTE